VSNCWWGNNGVCLWSCKRCSTIISPLMKMVGGFQRIQVLVIIIFKLSGRFLLGARSGGYNRVKE
jgi:hypothetical protein